MENKFFCRRVARKLGCDRELIVQIFGAILTEARAIIAEGDEFRLPGLGKIYMRVRPAQPFLDRFALASGIEVIHQLPERKKPAFDQEPDLRFVGSKKFENELNKPKATK